MIKTLVKLQIKLALLPARVALRLARRLLGRDEGAAEAKPTSFGAPAPGPPIEPGASPFDMQVDPGSILSRMAEGDQFVFVDVRQPVEVATSGRIARALHIPTQDLPRRMAELDRAAETVLYCAVGARSLDAAMFLREKGFENVWSLAGGLPHWQADGGEVVLDD